MKKLRRNVPESPQKNEKERIGRPMFFPIVFCLVSGLLLILLENLTLRITGYVLSAGLLILGAIMMVQYIRSEPDVRIVEAKLAVGLIMLVAGAMLAFSPDSLRELLPYAWGLALLFGGFLKVQYAFDRKSLGSQKWWILLIMAAFSIVIGVISLLNPDFLGDKRELVIGILLTLEAVLDIAAYLLLKRTIRKQAAATVPIPQDEADSDQQPEAAEPVPQETPAAPEPAAEPEAPAAPEAPDVPEIPTVPEVPARPES